MLEKGVCNHNPL